MTKKRKKSRSPSRQVKPKKDSSDSSQSDYSSEDNEILYQNLRDKIHSLELENTLLKCKQEPIIEKVLRYILLGIIVYKILFS
tara:strand:- start:63 stop:311 length:249 start_codon:yes stop_codon:yes gene_type:complete